MMAVLGVHLLLLVHGKLGVTEISRPGSSRRGSPQDYRVYVFED